MKTIAIVAGGCLAIMGCGTSPGETTGTGGSTTMGTGSGGRGGVMCAVTEMPLTPHPWTPALCDEATVTTTSNELEVARLPGWIRPVAFDQVKIRASANALDGGCTLDSDHSLLVSVGEDAPPAAAAEWTEVSFNPGLTSSGQDLIEVVVDIPRQTVGPGQNLFVAMKTMGDKGRLCFGICAAEDGWMWAGSDLGALTAASYQGQVQAHGKAQLACESTLHNNVETCPSAQRGRLAAAPGEDGDLVVERLVAQADLSVSEILLEMADGTISCVLPEEVEVIYFVGDAQAPAGSDFIEAKLPRASAYRVDDALAAFSVTMSPPLLVPAGKALYAGIRQHSSPATCMATCKGEGAAEGHSWWGHTHKQPGAVVWASLASEGFTVSLRVTAIHDKK